jgi:hypothetical protein
MLILLAAGNVHGGRDVAAEDAAAAARQYINNVIIGAGDVPGFRAIDPPEVDPTASGALGARAARFAPVSPGSKPLASFTVWVEVYPTVGGAHQRVAAIQNNDTVSEPGGTAIVYQHSYSLNGPIDEGEAFFWRRLARNGTVDVGSGWGWRLGTVFFEVSATGGTSVPTFERDAALNEVANIQLRKSTAAGPFVPASPGQPPAAPTATPTPPTTTLPLPAAPASPTPVAGAGGTGMVLLVTAQISGALVRDGTTIQALVGGRVCGAGQITHGWTFLSFDGAGTAACGAPGQTITFTIDGKPANEQISWNADSFARGVVLTTSGSVAGGVSLRPIVLVTCAPDSDEEACSPVEQRLWDGDLAAWRALFLLSDRTPDAPSLILAWAKFRADRGEPLGGMALAYLQGTSYTFISAVRYEPTDDEPNPYVEVASIGADRPVGGWRLEIYDKGAPDMRGSYTFPDGATMPDGVCRLYTDLDASLADTANTCKGALLPGGSIARPIDLLLVTPDGTVVDSLGI